jgi:hypothetical protein
MLTDADARARGWSDLETAQRAVSIHEAGHAVSMILGGAGVTEAVLRADLMGWVRSGDSYRVRAQDFIAGVVAERIHGCQGPEGHTGLSRADLTELARWGEAFGVETETQAFRVQTMQEAWAELSEPHAMAAVDMLAKGLRKFGRLSGVECDAIVRAAVAAPPPAMIEA